MYKLKRGKMRFGEIFSLSWKEYKNNFKVFAIVLILLSFIPAIITYIISIPFTLEYLKLGAQPTLSEILAIYFTSKYLLIFIFWIISFILSLWMSASLIYNSLYRKKEMSVKETLAGGGKYFWKFFGFSIVYFIFLALLFLLLIIPGIIFLVFWIFASYVFIGENKGILESLKTSKRIVQGRWWSTFGFLLLFGLIAFGISIVFSIIPGIISIITGFAYLTSPESIPPSIVITTNFISQMFSLLANLITTPLGILFFKNFYLDMKKTAKLKK